MFYVSVDGGFVLVTDDEPNGPHEPGLEVTTPGAEEGECSDTDGADR